MKRQLTVLLTALGLALGVGVGTAQATGLPAPPVVMPPTQSIDQSQANASENEQIQVVPIAPQANVQNVNVATFGDVDQGNANNVNTGQATQQENTQVAVQTGPSPSVGQSQTTEQGQVNASDNDQVQVVPIAPQLNVQNVNVLTKDDVEQGNANNANTGQATQQENAQVAVQTGGPGSSTGQSQTTEQGQANASENEQIQVVPIAPQANLQNVNVLTFGDVEQGNANNANTGQATQQENTQVAGQSSRGAETEKHSYGAKGGGCSRCSSQPSGDQSITQRQGNWSKQGQIQFIPIAPQLNVQNVNVLTLDDVEQGNANNANTGQATQQQNTQLATQHSASSVHDRKGGFEKQGYGAKGGECRCSSQPSGDQSIRQRQGNWSKNHQLQFVPIAPQANLQNVNVLTFGDVEQGNANNANTGQATQQENSQVARQHSGGACCGPTGPYQPQHKGRYEPKGSYEPKEDGHGGKYECGGYSHPSDDQSVRQGQGNWSKQGQIQFIPIAPQLNVQNVNVLTLDDVEQGNANNANTGQATQQQNTQLAVQGLLAGARR